MKRLLRTVEEHVPNGSSPKKQHNLETLVVFYLHAIHVRLYDGHLFETREHGYGNVRLLVLLRLFGCDVRRLSSHVARHVFSNPALFPPHEVDLGRRSICPRVILTAVKARCARRSERRLGQTEFVRDSFVPFRRLLPDYDLLIGVVELYSEFGRIDGLRWRWYASISAYFFLRQRRLRPARFCEHFSKENVGVVCVEEGSGVCIPRFRRRGVRVLQRIRGFGLGAILGEVEGFVMLDTAVPAGFKKERGQIFVQHGDVMWRLWGVGGSRRT